MIELNWMVILGTGVIPLIIGFLWYNPATFGNAWMKAADMTEDKMKGANMGVVFALSLLLGIFLAFGLIPVVIHQMGVFSVLQGVSGFDQPGSEVNQYFVDFMGKYGSNFRTFKHGAFHGVLTAIFVFLPVMAINALFERKSWKYIAINVGFWAVCAMLMGGIICAWG